MQEQTEQEFSLRELILKIKEWAGYLIQKLHIIIVIVFLGGIIGFVTAYYEKPMYTATLSFALEDEKGGGGLGGALGLASQFGFDLGNSAGGAFSGTNLIELMKSRNLVEKTLLNPININGKEISLADYFLNFNNWRKRWEGNQVLGKIKFLPGSDRSKYTLQQDSILGIIYKTLANQGKLIVSQKDKKVSIIDVVVKTENELFSKFFAEILAREVSDFYIETKSKKAKMNVAILEKQADSIRARLNAAISGVARANDEIYNLNPALNVKRVPYSQRQVDVQANTAILTELVKNLELARVTLRKETPLIQIVDSPILPLEKEKTGKIKLSLTYGFIGFFLSVIFLVGVRWVRLNIS